MAVVSGLVWQFILLLCSVYASEYDENVLNVPQLLLPYTPNGVYPANYTLKAIKGCLKWKSSKPDVATVVPIIEKESSTSDASSYQDIGDANDQVCSRSAMVTATSTFKEKSTAVVTAEDEASGILLRCDVFVDAIHRIEIATTTRELLLGETPEVFDVYGYDEEGNLFSTLGSTVFDWYLSPTAQQDSVDPWSVLRFLKFHGSSYDTYPEIRYLEDKGLLGSSVLVEGINTGEALVSAKLVHPTYKNVPPSTVKLTVVDNIVLDPSVEMFILIGSRIKYRVKQLRRGRSKEIPMPSNQYRFELDKKNTASLNPDDSSITGKNAGTVNIALIDNNVAHAKSLRQPTSTIHVVQPGSLGFRISPGNSWVLQTGKEYTITVEIYDAKKNKIYISDDTVLNSLLDPKFIEMKYRSSNQSFHHIKTIKKGQTNINATLIGVQVQAGFGKKLLKLKVPIFGEKGIEIFDELRIDPKITLFPWEGVEDRSYHVQLRASGGSGSYLWSSRNHSFVSVTNKGLVKTSNDVGVFKVKASDKRNSFHFAEATIIVLPPNEMHFIETRVEAEIGEILELPLSVSAHVPVDGAKVLKVFEDCRQLALTKAFTDDSIFSVVTSPVSRDSLIPDSCTVIRLKAVKMGFTSLTVSHRANGVFISAKITVGAYPPLVIVHPKDVATVTLGSSEIVTLVGGPQPWILDSSGFYESLSAEEDELVAIQPSEMPSSFVSKMKRHDTHFFKVTCRQLTELQLSGQVGNKPTAKNKFPANSVTKLRFLCTPPGSLSLKPDIVLPTIDDEQMTLESCQDSNKLIPVRNGRELMILLIVRDQNGQIFANASSLDIKWSSSDTKLARISQRSAANGRIKSNNTATVVQSVILSGQVGAVKINAKVSGYREVALYAIGIYDGQTKATIAPPITGTLGLLLVNERQIVPDKMVLLNHPKNKANLKLNYGSHFYRMKTNDNNIGYVQKLPSELVVTPRYPGNFIISVYDICLDAEGPATAQVTFADVYGIEVSVADKVGLEETIKAVVQIKDSRGNYLSFRNLKLMDLAPHFSNDIIKIKLDEASAQIMNQFINKAVFTLEGSAIGLTSLTFNAFKSDGKRISSRPKDIQVFPPLHLDPRHIVLVAGATFQVQSSGGPRPESTIVFEIGNKAVANVSSSGIIHTLTPGNSTLLGRAQGLDPHTGKPIVYSKDMITIEVIRLKGFKIHLPTKTIKSGSQVGIYATGLSDEGPFTFALSNPFLEFHWSLSNNDVAVLESVYQKTGVTVEREKDFRVVLNTRKAGETAIKLKVQTTNAFVYNDILHKGAILEDEVQLQVFDGLKVLFPENDKMLLPPNAEAKIKTNKDGITRLSYQVIKGCNTGEASASIIDISSDGLIRTSSASGVAVVQITSHEDFGLNQTAMINVEIRAVASITLKSLSSVIASQGNRHSFPLGAVAMFAITLHDNVGRKFDVSSIQLKHRIQRFDVINVVPDAGSDAYIIKAVKVGNAILKVWDRYNPDVSDYVRVSVGYGIQSSRDDIHEGDLVCFKSTKSPGEEPSTSWSTSNPDIMEIDHKSGTAIAKAPGVCTVYANYGDFVTQIELKVQKAFSLQVYPIKDIHITNVPVLGKNVYSFSIEANGLSKHQRDVCAKGFVPSGAFAAQVPLTCTFEHGDENERGIVDQSFDVTATFRNGQPFCEVTVKELSSESIMQMSTTEMVLSLRAALRGKDDISSSLQLEFLPAFYVNKKSIELTPERPRDLITVTGVVQQILSLVVQPEDSSVIVVEQLSLPAERKTSVDFEVRLLETGDKQLDKTAVIIRSGLTGQVETLSITVHLNTVTEQAQCAPVQKISDGQAKNAGDEAIVFSLPSSWLLFYSLVIATFILMIFVYHNVVSYRDRMRMVYDVSGSQLAPPPYQTPYTGHGSPYRQQWTPVTSHERPHSPASERRSHSGYQDQNKTTPGNRTLFSVGQ